jgi:hypothetical protein
MQGTFPNKEASTFLKKRSSLDDEYARNLMKLAAITKSDGKQGSYLNAFNESMKLHLKLAEIRMQLAANVLEISENIATLQRNTERSRKQLKDAGLKHYRLVQDAELSLEKARGKFENSTEEWEKAQQHEHGGKQTPKTGISNFTSFIKVYHVIRNRKQRRIQEKKHRLLMNCTSSNSKKPMRFDRRTFDSTSHV